MRVGLQTWGTEGDHRPFLALARGLLRAGHEVTLVSTAVDGVDHAAVLAGTGAVLIRVPPQLAPELTDGEVVSRLLRERNPLRQVELTLSAFLDPIVDDLYRVAVELCAGCDLVVGHMMVHPLFAAAERSGRPLATLSPIHVVFPSGDLKPMGAPLRPRWLYPFWWWLVGRAMKRLFGARVNELRRRVGLEPIRDLMDRIRAPPSLSLIAVSPVFCERRPRGWGPNHQLCGFLDLQDDQGWRMPPDLEAFLAAGPPPVFLGIGSMLTADPSPRSRERSLRLLVEAAAASGSRAIVQGPWRELPEIEVPSSVHRLERAPHGAVFPRCAAIVHHGGAGTSHAALRAGVPSVVVAHGNDQIVWAEELHRLGVAPSPLHRRTVTSARLARAIRQVLASPDMLQRARVLAGRMKDEDGVGRAVALLEERWAARGSRSPSP